MALWGRKDSVYSTGKVNVNYGTLKVTKHSGSINFTSGGVSAGDIITVGAGNSFGEAIITAVDSNTQLSISSTAYLASGVTTVTSSDYLISQKPKSTLFDSKYGEGQIFGVDNGEVGVARTTAYSVTHGGWVGITSYIQNNADGTSTLRVKTESLVAMGRGEDVAGDADTGGISGDAENVKYTD